MEKSRSITANNATIPDAGTDAGHSLWSDAWLRLRHNRAAMCGCAVLGLIILMCFIVPFLPALPDPAQQDLPGKNSTPSWSHWMGTDHLGRDLFSRILHGGRISILVGLITTMVSLTIGVAVGAVAGYLGGKVDAFLMRTVDILYSLPFLIIVILFSALAKGYTSDLTDWLVGLTGFNRDAIAPFTGLIPLFVAIGALSWLSISRIVRASVQDIAGREFVEAAKSLGLSHRRILMRHIIPNAIGPIVVYATLTIPSVMLFEATLSFLGMGVQPPYSSWGILIKDGADRMLSNPLLLIFPSIFFILTLLSLNFLGDGLRDALDPKSSKD
ncbi:MAG: ABC transporter permease [Akkermansiaceae bacterium]|jgi:oligopeptide transport system permease protein|nr:ABC transporter permease [Akkermansiaceae bacterium]